MRDVHGVVYQPRERPSAAKRGYDARWRKIRKIKLAKDPFCEDPYGFHGEIVVPATLVDHIVPLSQGESHAMDNLQSLCNSCHQHKTNTEDGGGWPRR